MDQCSPPPDRRWGFVALHYDNDRIDHLETFDSPSPGTDYADSASGSFLAFR